MGILHFPVHQVSTSLLVFSWIPILIYGYIVLPSLSRLDICTCLFLDTHLHFGVHCTSQSFQSWYPYNTIQLYCLCVEKFAAYFAWIPFRMSGFIALLIVNTHSHLCVCCTYSPLSFKVRLLLDVCGHVWGHVCACCFPTVCVSPKPGDPQDQLLWWWSLLCGMIRE